MNFQIPAHNKFVRKSESVDIVQVLEYFSCLQIWFDKA